MVIITGSLVSMTPRFLFIPSWEPQTSICDILKVFPTVGAELGRLGVPATLVHNCITVDEVANYMGWNPYALLRFLIPLSNADSVPVSLLTIKGVKSLSYVGLIQELRTEHIRLFGGYISPIRKQWGRWESEGYPSQLPILSTLKDKFETLCAEISCHFLLEEEVLFPYLMELHQACSAQISQQEAFKILENKSFPVDEEIIALVHLFEYLLSHFPSEFKASPDSSFSNLNNAEASSKSAKNQEVPDSENVSRIPAMNGNQPRLINPFLSAKDLQHGRELWANLIAFRQSWMQHEAKETDELFPRILELENHLLRKN